MSRQPAELSLKGQVMYVTSFQASCALRRGDPGDDFRFATFFPEALQPAVDRVASVFSRSQGEAADARPPATSQGGPLPGSESLEAARRRWASRLVAAHALKGGVVACLRPSPGMFDFSLFCAVPQGKPLAAKESLVY